MNVLHHWGLTLFASLCFIPVWQLSGRTSGPLDTEEISPTNNTADVSAIVATGSDYGGWTNSTRRIVTDIDVPGAISALGLRYVRTYSSQSGYWSPSYGWSVFGEPYGFLTANFPDGRGVLFMPLEKAKRATAGPKKRIFETGPRFGLDGRVTQGTAELHLEDGSIVHFNRITERRADGDGFDHFYLLSHLTDPHGAETTFSWESTGIKPDDRRLIRVTDASGHFLSFTYDPITGALTQVAASTGQYARYSSNGVFGAGHIEYIDYSDGTRAAYPNTNKPAETAFLNLSVPAAPSSQINSLTLINAQTNLPISILTHNTTLNLATLPSALNVRADVTGAIGKVEFKYDGIASRTEATAPYAAFGDSSGDYHNWLPTLGNHNITATPYSPTNQVGPSLTIQFNVINQAGPTPTPTPSPTPGVMVFPGANWATSSPAKQNVEPLKLHAAMSYLSGYLSLSEAAIIRNGYMIWNGGNLGFSHGTWSITKSFTSTAMGLMIDDGKVRLDDLARNCGPGLATNYPTVTLRNFATMTSGYGVANVYNFWTPGTPWWPRGTFAYDDIAMKECAYILTRALNNACSGGGTTNQSLANLFKSRIADRIGMTNWSWPIANVGGFSAVVNGSGWPYWQFGPDPNYASVNLDVNAALRFGHLFLNNGKWKGQQLISSNWVAQVRVAQVPLNNPVPNPIYRDLDGRGIYSFNWWSNSNLKLFPSAPRGTYQAHGLHENAIIVVPEWNMVIVRLGLNAQALEGRSQQYSHQIWDGFFSRLKNAVY